MKNGYIYIYKYVCVCKERNTPVFIYRSTGVSDN